MKKALLSVAVLLAVLASARAATTQFDLVGTAGPGLLFGNEPNVTSGGTGGEIDGGTNGFGVFYNDANLTLTLNIGWGSSQGFTDLTSTANNSHIHGPTGNNFGNSGGTNFFQTAGVLFNLIRSSSAATGGTIITNIVLTSAQQTDLFNGKYYINIHTVNNGGGELRGFLVPVPEPSIIALAIVGGIGFAAWRLRRR